MATKSRSDATLGDRAAVFKALGEPTRLRIVDFLRHHRGEATGREVAEHAGISLALLCHHADALVDAGVVLKRKEGQTSYWRLNSDVLAGIMRYLGD
ncbi:MAG TPA: metalloregulator ArsR/SmtB family transcription factor [Gemmatimonadales bacterium]